jgi:hypothetical protein
MGLGRLEGKDALRCVILRDGKVPSLNPLTTGRPFLSKTVTSRKTRFDVTLIFGTSDDLCWAWALSSGKVASTKAADRKTLRNFIAGLAQTLLLRGKQNDGLDTLCSKLATLIGRESQVKSKGFFISSNPSGHFAYLLYVDLQGNGHVL